VNKVICVSSLIAPEAPVRRRAVADAVRSKSLPDLRQGVEFDRRAMSVADRSSKQTSADPIEIAQPHARDQA
jgi:hypothetical protein